MENRTSSFTFRIVLLDAETDDVKIYICSYHFTLCHLFCNFLPGIYFRKNMKKMGGREKRCYIKQTAFVYIISNIMFIY